MYYSKLERYILFPIIFAFGLFTCCFLLFACYFLFIWMPFHLNDEIHCLEAGYPKTNTTITLKGYCINLDGDITTKVKSVDKL